MMPWKCTELSPIASSYGAEFLLVSRSLASQGCQLAGLPAAASPH